MTFVKKYSDLLKRSISGLLLVAGMVIAILASKYTYFALFFFIQLFSLYEFYRIILKLRISVPLGINLIAGAFIFSISFFHAASLAPIHVYLFLIPFFFIIFASSIFRNSQKGLLETALSLTGILYVSIPLSLLNYLVFNTESLYLPQIILIYLAFIWLYDSGAYIVGIGIGRHKLLERISPKKSWEGAVGGFLITLILALLLKSYLPINTIQLIIMAIVVPISATIGDLFESLIKRNLKIKDSGNFLPGHGGLLDRFDSIFLSSPILYFSFKLIEILGY